MSQANEDAAAERVKAAADVAAARLKAVADAAAAELSGVVEDITQRIAGAAGLAGEVHSLNVNMDKLNKQDQVNKRQLRRNKIVNKVFIAAFVFIAALITIMGFVISANLHTGHQVKDAIATQTRTVNDVLCPLYSIFLHAYDPSKQPPANLKTYEAQYVIIRHSYTILGCTPAIPLPTPTPSH